MRIAYRFLIVKVEGAGLKKLQPAAGAGAAGGYAKNGRRNHQSAGAADQPGKS